MDLDDVDFEIRVASEVAEQLEGVLLEDDEVLSEQETDEEGRVTVVSMKAEDEVMVLTHGRVRGVTIVSIPAFASAFINLDEEEEPVLVAGAGGEPWTPPALWFENPQLTELTGLTVDEDGRVYGHLAGWNTCHSSHTAQGVCVLAPRSKTGYAGFHTSRVVLDNGAELGVGVLTVDGPHAPQGRRITPEMVRRHYEDTGTAAAYVRAGEDEHGIWVAGAMSPFASKKAAHALRTHPLSGDWREDLTTGNLELLGALCINYPGFAVPRTSGMVAGGSLRSLVAAGMVVTGRGEQYLEEEGLSESDVAYLRRLANRERRVVVDTLARKRRAQKMAMRLGRV